jgi:hypothetical protein
MGGRGDLHLTGLAMPASRLTPENHRDLLGRTTNSARVSLRASGPPTFGCARDAAPIARFKWKGVHSQRWESMGTQILQARSRRKPNGNSCRVGARRARTASGVLPFRRYEPLIPTGLKAPLSSTTNPWPSIT